MIYDPEENGAYHMYWSSATNQAYWFEVARYGGGRPVDIGEQEAGFEGATEYAPYHLGRQMVAALASGGWTSWEGDWWYKNPGVCMWANSESSAAGNIEWDPGHNKCS